MTATKTILITGSGGFIGTALCRKFEAQGWRVIGTSRKKQNENNTRYFDLGDEIIETSLFENADVLLHAAFISSGKNTVEQNTAGTKRLLEAARKAGVKKNIFLSSLAAHPEALSDYGRQKLAIEKLFSGAGDLIVRPGLVLGHGGLFGRMQKHLAKSSIIPLFGKGDQPIQCIHIDDLTEAIALLIQNDASGAFTLAESEPVSYRTFYKTLGEVLGKKTRFVRLPFWFMQSIIALMKLSGLRPPVDRDNLLGLKKMIRWNTEKDLERCHIRLRSWKESLDQLAKGR